MRVDWIVLCRYAEVHDGLATIVGAGLDNVIVPELPIAIPINAVTRLAGLPDTAEHTMTVQILDPMMSPVGEQIPPATFTMNPPGPGFPVGSEAQILQPMIFRVPLEHVGAYTIVVAVDGNSEQAVFRVALPTA